MFPRNTAPACCNAGDEEKSCGPSGSPDQNQAMICCDTLFGALQFLVSLRFHLSPRSPCPQADACSRSQRQYVCSSHSLDGAGTWSCLPCCNSGHAWLCAEAGLHAHSLTHPLLLHPWFALGRHRIWAGSTSLTQPAGQNGWDEANGHEQNSSRGTASHRGFQLVK